MPPYYSFIFEAIKYAGDNFDHKDKRIDALQR